MPNFACFGIGGIFVNNFSLTAVHNGADIFSEEIGLFFIACKKAIVFANHLLRRGVIEVCDRFIRENKVAFPIFNDNWIRHDVKHSFIKL